MSFFIASLASGSSGNAYYLQSPEGAILVDAGLSGVRIIEAITQAGGDPALVKGVIVTHEHHDHVSGAGVLQRKHNWRLWMTAGTRDAAAKRLGKVEVEVIRDGSGLRAAGMDFEFHATPHDGCEPIVVTAEYGGRRCGVCTDLGHPRTDLATILNSLDFVVFESNYDPDLLKANPRYSASLKARIQGKHGHLSNPEAGELVRCLTGDRLRRVLLAHLSEENNRPDLAKRCFTETTAERIEAIGMKVGVARRHAPTLLCRV